MPLLPKYHRVVITNIIYFLLFSLFLLLFIATRFFLFFARARYLLSIDCVLPWSRRHRTHLDVFNALVPVTMRLFIFVGTSQTQRISERAFDGLNNLRILNLENNKITMLEGATFSGVPAVTTLNLNKNLLETLTYQNVLPIMDNLVNNTESVLSISGECYFYIYFLCAFACV